MGKFFNSVGHVLAWVLHVGLPKSEAAVSEAVTVAESPLVTAIAGAIGSKGESVQRGLEAIGGDVLHAFASAGAAIGADGLNVKFDLATIEAIKAIYADVSGLFTAPGRVAVQGPARTEPHA